MSPRSILALHVWVSSAYDIVNQSYGETNELFYLVIASWLLWVGKRQQLSLHRLQVRYGSFRLRQREKGEL